MRLSNQNKIVVGVIALILALAVGYAIFSETLNIRGTASASGEFSLIFNTVGEIKEVGSHGATADIINNNKTLDISVPALEYPSAYVEIPVTIKNTGSIDAILKGITTKGLTNDDITVTYSGIEKDEIIRVNEEKEMKIKVKWNESSTTSMSTLEDFNIELVYEQVTGENGGGETNPGGKENYELGDEFCLGDECFYTISDNGDTVTALSKYNLLVGNITTVNAAFEIVSSTPISSDTIGYGRQSSDAKGSVMTDTTWTGTIAFTDEFYWKDEDYNLLPEYGENYPADVYDSNSILYEYVKNYENYLRDTLGKSSVGARILTLNELISLGCKKEEMSCNSAPAWIYSTTYWSATASNGANAWNVFSNGMFVDGAVTADSNDGIRPVITILKSEI